MKKKRRSRESSMACMAIISEGDVCRWHYAVEQLHVPSKQMLNSINFLNYKSHGHWNCFNFSKFAASSFKNNLKAFRDRSEMWKIERTSSRQEWNISVKREGNWMHINLKNLKQRELAWFWFWENDRKNSNLLLKTVEYLCFFRS